MITSSQSSILWFTGRNQITPCEEGDLELDDFGGEKGLQSVVITTILNPGVENYTSLEKLNRRTSFNDGDDNILASPPAHQRNGEWLTGISKTVEVQVVREGNHAI